MEAVHRHRMQPLQFTALNSLLWRKTVSTAATDLEIVRERITSAALARFTCASANAFAPIMQMCNHALFIHVVGSL
jgi:hypothetical protein